MDGRIMTSSLGHLKYREAGHTAKVMTALAYTALKFFNVEPPKDFGAIIVQTVWKTGEITKEILCSKSHTCVSCSNKPCLLEKKKKVQRPSHIT